MLLTFIEAYFNRLSGELLLALKVAISVLILSFFLVLRIFWADQLADQFRYFNFSLYLVIFWADQSKKAPCIILKTDS